jgi:hypothetical protein
LVELNSGGGRPRRICAECGAEEEGWGCGYRVLTMQGDTWHPPQGQSRALILRTSNPDAFYRYRKSGPLYFVGQSDPKFHQQIATQ